MRYWFARFGFSFLVLAFALAYTGYRAAGEGAERPRVYAYYLAAVVSLSLGLAALRERPRK